MYVYLAVHKNADELYTYNYLINVCATKKKAEDELIQYNKFTHVNKEDLIVIKKRVDRKDIVFVVMEEFEEADTTLRGMLHCTTSEKRAKGFIKNLAATKQYPENMLKISGYDVLA